MSTQGVGAFYARAIFLRNYGSFRLVMFHVYVGLFGALFWFLFSFFTGYVGFLKGSGFFVFFFRWLVRYVVPFSYGASIVFYGV